MDFDTLQSKTGNANKDREFFQELKTRIHRRLIDKLDLSKVDMIGSNELVREIGYIIESLIVEEGVPLNQVEKDRLVVEIQHETFGLGPLEPLLSDPEISDILVNNSSQVYIERFGKLQKTDICFRDDKHLLQIIERIVSKVGRRIDESSPYVDARLPDGSRVNAIIPPLAIDGPALSIRRFGMEPLKIERPAPLRHHGQPHRQYPPGRSEDPPQHPDLRRYRQRENNPAERTLRVHPL